MLLGYYSCVFFPPIFMVMIILNLNLAGMSIQLDENLFLK